MTDLKTAGAAVTGALAGGAAIVVADGIAKELGEGDTRDAGGLIAAGAGVGSGLAAAAIRKA